LGILVAIGILFYDVAIHVSFAVFNAVSIKFQLIPGITPSLFRRCLLFQAGHLLFEPSYSGANIR